MQTSSKGVAALEHDEGVVLKAYLCPAGVWTIGAGLTAASGVVRPKAGMVITRAEATTLLQRALREGYEPTVKEAMPGAKQHEFDAAVSFHFNTGAIRRASWVGLWRKKAPRGQVAAKFLIWNKGGGKVLPGLTARRQRELKLLQDGVYPASAAAVRQQKAAHPLAAVWALPMSSDERAAAITGLRKLGYPMAPETGAPDVANAVVIKNFQRDHGLTVDGIIGRATLSTLQRRLDANRVAVPAVSAPAVAATGSASGTWDAIGAGAIPDSLLLAGAAAFTLWSAWRYRDAIAAKVQQRLPRVASFLRGI